MHFCITKNCLLFGRALSLMEAKRKSLKLFPFAKKTDNTVSPYSLNLLQHRRCKVKGTLLGEATLLFSCLPPISLGVNS